MINRSEGFKMLQEKYPQHTSLELVLKEINLEDQLRSLVSMYNITSNTQLDVVQTSEIERSFIGLQSSKDQSIIYKLAYL